MLYAAGSEQVIVAAASGRGEDWMMRYAIMILWIMNAFVAASTLVVAITSSSWIAAMWYCTTAMHVGTSVIYFVFWRSLANEPKLDVEKFRAEWNALSRGRSERGDD